MNDIVLMVMAVSASVGGWIATQLILKLVRGRREHLQERLSTQRPTETPANYRSIVLPKKDDWAAGKAYAVAFGEGDAPWKKIFDAVEQTGGVEYYLIEQETGGPDGALAMVSHCLDNYKKIHT